MAGVATDWPSIDPARKYFDFRAPSLRLLSGARVGNLKLISGRINKGTPEPRNEPTPACVVDSERLLQGGTYVLQRMWFGSIARARDLSPVWPSGRDRGATR